MIQFMEGNLLDSDTDALVNTVNTVGIMGKGIALQFKQAFPENFKAYERACARGEVRLGEMHVVQTARLENPRIIINFPTKAHWRSKARLNDIERGIDDLVRVIERHQVRSIAIPPLGCGNGGLNWSDVRPLIMRALANLDIEVLLFEPKGAPEAEAMPVATGRPRLSSGRAALIGLMREYMQPGYRLTLLEAQKLAYFLQKAGQPLQLKFVANKYGPYAETLNHVLQRLEGHYTRGYGDRSGQATIRLMDQNLVGLDEVLEEQPIVRSRYERIRTLIEGFETPYGLELLATIHWLGEQDPIVREDMDAAVAGVHGWSRRKQTMFKRRHIEAGWNRLAEHGWLAP